MENDKFGLPQRCGANQTAVSPRCSSSLTRFVLQLQSAHVSRAVSWSATFLLILVTLGIAGCGVTVPGVSSKTSGTGTLSVSASSVSFGSVTVGNSAAATVTVTNTGTAAIQVSNAQVVGQYFSMTGATSPMTIAAGSSVTVTVNFAPRAIGSAAGTLAFTTTNSTTTIGLSGTGTAAQVAGLTLSTSSLAFGSATVNTPVTESVTLTSSGTAALTISAATVTGTGFTMSGLALPVTLSPGQTASLTLTFNPANAGPFSGALTLTTNTSDGAATIQMSGTGVTVQSVLSDFACDSDTLVGQGTENCTLTLSSPADTGGLSVALGSSSTAVTLPTLMTIPQGSTSGTFTLSYFPVASAQSVTLTASTNNSHKQHNLNLSASTPGLKMNPASVSFGNVKLNSTATQAVTLTSSGTAALTISAATVTGAGYGVSGMALPLTLNPGQTANLTVSFDPTVAGSVTGSVALATNLTTGTADIALSGTGAPDGSLSALSCASASMTGAGTDLCTVSLTSAAGTSGLAVALSSNNSAVVVPSSVTVPAGATSIGFTATVSSVTTAQTATLTAQAGGITATYAISLGAAATPALSAVSCASSSMTGAGTDACTVSLTAAAPAGGITVGLSSSSSAVVVPASVTVPAGATSVGFTATVASVTTAQTATLTAQAGGVTASYAISLGAAATPALSTISCASGSMTGSGTDACAVSLTAAAGTGGLSIALSSNNSAVVVPASVLVPAGSTRAAFTATVSWVTTAQTATLTGQAGGVTATYPISLGAAAPGLTLASTSVPFGNVNLNTTTTQQVQLTSSGTAPLTISAATVTGTGFTISGITAPLTLNPGQSAMLNINFDPTTATAVTGAVTLTTNASPSTATIALSGTGQSTSYSVDLTWTAPSSSSDPVAGYHVYRSTDGVNFQQITSALDNLTNYADSTVVSGTNYTYYVVSVDATGNESPHSNTWIAAIP